MRTVLALGMCLLVGASSAGGATVAFWDFNATTNVTGVSTDLWRINPFGTTAAKTEYPKDLGDGTAQLSVWGAGSASDGNLVGNNGDSPSPNVNHNFGSFTGTTLNDIKSPQVAGGSLSITGSNNNDHYFLIKLDDPVANCVLTYATRGTSTGYGTHIVDYSTDNGATWTNLNFHSANKTSTWEVHTANFGNIFAGTGGDNNLIRITVTGCTSNNGNNRFDNILVVGDIVPEPATLALIALGLPLIRRRK